MRRGDEGSDRLEVATEAIVVRFRGGEPAITGEIRARVGRILAFRGWGIPPEDRLDLAQKIMTELWQAVQRPAFKSAGFWGLVEVVSSRRCIDWRRAQRDERSLDDIDEPLMLGPDALGSFLKKERLQQARRVLAQLPPSCRKLIRLNAWEGRSYREIAEILGASEGALRVQMFRCIRRARQLLAVTSDTAT